MGSTKAAQHSTHMNIGVQINSRTFGDYVTEDFVAHVRSQGSKIMVEFMYPLEEGFDQESGWVFLSPAQAQQLGAALLAVAGGYTGGKKASFSASNGAVTHFSVGE